MPSAAASWASVVRQFSHLLHASARTWLTFRTGRFVMALASRYPTAVERWAEASGNAGLAGRELPPAQVLAADQRVTARAKELRRAGLDGGLDALRAQAFLDILLGMDSRPLGTKPGDTREPRPSLRNRPPARAGRWTG